MIQEHSSGIVSSDIQHIIRQTQIITKRNLYEWIDIELSAKWLCNWTQNLSTNSTESESFEDFDREVLRTGHFHKGIL